MIISHKHKFIYIKTIKTASSSIEISLSSILGDDDILTPARSDLEEQRADGRHAQNYRINHPAVPKRPLIKRLLGRPERYYHPSVGYFEHMPAWRVKTYIGDEIWNNYFKFSFERNPWDRQVSFYFYKTRNMENRPSFETFMNKGRRAHVENFDLYSIDGKIVLDFIGRVENLSAEFDHVLKTLELIGKITLPKTNVSPKHNTDSYRDLYTEKTRKLVAKWYSREIEAFGYEF